MRRRDIRYVEFVPHALQKQAQADEELLIAERTYGSVVVHLTQHGKLRGAKPGNARVDGGNVFFILGGRVLAQMKPMV